MKAGILFISYEFRNEIGEYLRENKYILGMVMVGYSMEVPMYKHSSGGIPGMQGSSVGLPLNQLHRRASRCCRHAEQPAVHSRKGRRIRRHRLPSYLYGRA